MIRIPTAARHYLHASRPAYNTRMNIEAALREGCSRCGQPWKIGDKVHHEQLDDVVYAYHQNPTQCGNPTQGDTDD